MLQKSQYFFLLLPVLEFILTTSAVQIDFLGHELICTFPNCEDITLHCSGSEEGVEWINTDNFLINSTQTARIHIIDGTGLMKIRNPQVADSGRYTCRAKNNHSDTDEWILTVKQRPRFIFSNSSIYEDKSALRYTDVFINCSVEPIDAYTSWDFENATISDFSDNKYSQNISGLIIYNVTEEDQGTYVCFLGNIDPLRATIFLNVIRQSEVENRTMETNTTEDVRTDCIESGCTSTSSIPVQIITSPKTCTIPKCSSVSFLCYAHIEEIEWLNPYSTVINGYNSTRSSRIYAIALTGLMEIKNPQVSDSGTYTCRAKADHSNHDEVVLVVNQYPTFTFSSTSIYEEKIAVRYSNVFINCSVNPIDAYTSWDFKNTRIAPTNGSKYSQNISGLMIKNVTKEDQGHYICFIGNIDSLNATILLSVVWPPEFYLPQNETMVVDVNEEVILNSSASSSPHAVYTWLIPRVCSSCQKHRNDSIMTVIANISSSGDYICVAKNSYGSVTKQFTINVNSKPLIATESVKHIMESQERSNLILTCRLEYAYPAPSIEWSILNPLSNEYTLIQNNSTNYKLHRNGSFELLHRFLFEIGYIIIMCSATNHYGSANTTFYLWEHETFMRKQEFTVYLSNITNCEYLEKNKDLFRKMMDSLREWFDSACEDYCNGHNNLYTPQLTCLDDNMATISSIVHNEGENSAQMLINLAIVDMQARNPPAIYLSNGWMLRLNQSSPENKNILHSSSINSSEQTSSSINLQQTSSSNNSQQAVIGVSIGVAVIIVILLLIAIGTVFGIKKRYLKVRNTNVKGNEQTNDHIYDEVGNYSKVSTVSKSHSALYNTKDDNIIFEVSASQTPAYRPLKPLDDNCNTTRKENFNDYYIDGEDNPKAENMYKEEKYITSDCQKELQNDPPYNKLMHIKQ